MRIIALLPILGLVCESALANTYWEKPPAIPDGYSKLDEHVIDDMPPILSQDTFGLCYSFSSATVLNFWKCQISKVKDKSYKCGAMPEKDRFSAIGLARYSNDDDGEGIGDEAFDRLQEGGDEYPILKEVIYSRKAASEECASLDRFLSKVGGAKGQGTISQGEVWESYKSAWEKVRRAKSCKSCNSDEYVSALSDGEKLVKNRFNVGDNEQILKSFGKDSFDKALNELMYPSKCSQSENMLDLDKRVPLTVASYPPAQLDKDTGFDQTMSQLKSNLDKKIPTIVGFCASLKPTPQCSDSKKKGSTEKHSVVVVGYRKYCKSSDSNSCSYALKVQNSWGAKWQEDNSWIDAKTLLDNTFYERRSMMWLEVGK